MLKQFLKYCFVAIGLSSAVYSSEIFQNFESDYTSFNVGELYSAQRGQLQNSVVYFFVTAYKQERFAQNLARSLKLNYDRLNQFEVDFKIIITCDGRIKDYDTFSQVFESLGIPQNNVRISLNQKNKGCSRTRFDQLLNSREEILADINQGRNVYFSIFDGDDMIHRDYCLLMLTVALDSDADVVGIGPLAARCGEKDVPYVKELCTKNIDHVRLNYLKSLISEFTINIFNAYCLYKKVSDFFENTQEYLHDIEKNEFDKDISFITLDPLVSSYLFLKQFIITNNDQYLNLDLFNVEPVQDTNDDFTPMFFYMQHHDSAEGSPLIDALNQVHNQKIFKSIMRIRIEYINNYIFLFGFHDHINPHFIKNPKKLKNINITEELLLKKFKNNHLLAHQFEENVDSLRLNINESVVIILNDPKMQELLAQDTSKPLPEKFMKVFYRPVFDILLANEPNPIPPLEYHD